ncbi:hypothetical protein D083_1278 [Dickeya solani RNS 08.23.3.1.A]|nr:hypothetical protein D083_1278 [Dickeya solani RNS 08.23.3.1.A]
MPAATNSARDKTVMACCGHVGVHKINAEKITILVIKKQEIKF